MAKRKKWKQLYHCLASSLQCLSLLGCGGSKGSSTLGECVGGWCEVRDYACEEQENGSKGSSTLGVCVWGGAGSCEKVSVKENGSSFITALPAASSA